jgi:hypothetical protein
MVILSINIRIQLFILSLRVSEHSLDGITVSIISINIKIQLLILSLMHRGALCTGAPSV